MGRVVGQKMSRAGGLDSGGTGGASYALEDALDEPFIESDANSDGEPAEAGRSAWDRVRGNPKTRRQRHRLRVGFGGDRAESLGLAGVGDASHPSRATCVNSR